MTQTIIDKLERADGPDRNLDAMIHFHVTAGIGCGMAQDAPHYTSSIDAAMKLVPDREFICIDGPRRYLHIPTPVPNYWRACLGYTKSGQVWAKTPALALAAAALRAGRLIVKD